MYDLQQNQRLQQCIDIVNIALGFLQYSRREPHTLMKRFMTTLKMQGKLTKSVSFPVCLLFRSIITFMIG